MNAQDDAASSAREPRTFDECFLRYHRMVATVGCRILGYNADIDDFVQDVFLEVHRSFASLSKPEAVGGWIRVIAVRVAMRRARRHRVRMALGLDKIFETDTVSVDASQEDAALLDRLYRTLDKMPAQSRVCWVLRHLEGEKIDDIAMLTNLSRSTVKRHLTKATVILQQVFDDS
ncbi:MAG: sigma-70 family RNA polymerase sigma factor [Myxococcota bacterium]